MELAYHLLTFHFLLLCLSFVPFIATAVTDTKTDLAALLSFKSQIHSDPLKVFSSWNESRHYCQWQGVMCSRRHVDRVTALLLDSQQLSGYISPSLANLTFLQKISLSDNQLQGEIPTEFGYLHRLRFVNLSMNILGGSIPPTFGNCSKLEVISLENNNLNGTIPSKLSQCKELRTIYLGNNYIIGCIPPILGNLTNLYTLYLYQNGLSCNIPSSLGNLNSVVNIMLHQNSLSGSIPYALGKLQNLQYFAIDHNNISGEIPHSLYNISSMVALEVGENQLEGNLPSDICSVFSNLKYLALFQNQLSGWIPPTIANCSALIAVELDSNYLSGIIPSSIGNLKNLQYFIVGSNQLEAKSAHDLSFIDALTNCTSLQILDIGDNQLQGALPTSITNLSTNLYQLSMFTNPISGSIPIGLGKFTNLTTLNLRQMLITGTIPIELGNLFELGLLDLSNNMISGQIPSTFANLTRMNQLFLNDNAFEGSIPPELINMQVLESLDLSNNKLTGKIPKEIMGLSSLSIGLDLSRNYLTDILPPEIGNLKNLQLMRLSSNNLTGELPSTIGGCQYLQALYLGSNLFQGNIPSTLRNIRGLQVLDISNNSFSGQVPAFISGMNLQYLNISLDNFEGELPKEGIFKNVSGLDVRGNPKLCGGVHELHLPPCTLEPMTHHSSKDILLVCSILGASICVIIVICLLVTCFSKRRSQNNLQFDRALKYELMHVSYNELLRATKNFSSENLIGRGTFGKVYKAIMSIENVKTVAVKVINLERHDASRSFFSECKALRNVRHRNLIKVLSLCSSIDHQGNDFKALVFEYMPNGSLETWLHQNSFNDMPVRNLNFSQRLSIAIDVATALDYLHSQGQAPIVHCDLKPSNVLLDDDMTAHVGDFGLARFLVPPDSLASQSMTSTGRIKGSIGYIPPE